jgi:hypothetical protein
MQYDRHNKRKYMAPALTGCRCRPQQEERGQTCCPAVLKLVAVGAAKEEGLCGQTWRSAILDRERLL